jgi:hypothetical protein
MKPELMDEEARLNESARMQPGQQPAPAPQPTEGMDPEIAAERAGAGPRPASPEEEKLFASMVKQALQFLTSKEAGDFLLASVKAKGPEAALAEAVGEALAGITQAAASAGVELPEEVKGAAAQAATNALAGLMAKGGMTQDPQALAAAAMQMLHGGGEDVAPG